VNIDEAFQKALQVIEDEPVTPTLKYEYVGEEWPTNVMYQQAQMRQMGLGPAIAAQYGLNDERKRRPREVYENPRLYVFSSANFDLLIKIFSQVADSDRPLFMSRIFELVRRPNATQPVTPQIFPHFEGRRSYLGLVAEFAIRTRFMDQLLEAANVPELPSAGLAVMLKQIEETIALNFNLFSDHDLQQIPTALSHLREVAKRQTYSSSGIHLSEKTTRNPDYRPGYEKVGREIVGTVDAIIEECRKARYFYLKGALHELPNLEIESDKLKVASYLEKLGFNPDMVGALNAAESDYKATATTFELKNCLSHLRSFLEHLHRESVKSIAAAAGDSVVDRWGDATIYLRQKGYFTLRHENFVTALYTLISDESVHPLGADREYGRLLRTMVIEYGVMFLSVLDKRGVKI
jgi:hypothetical protein